MTILKGLFDATPSHMARACAHKNITSVLEACNCMGIRVVVRACGCKEDIAMVLRACGHKEDTTGVVVACRQKEDTTRWRVHLGIILTWRWL